MRRSVRGDVEKRILGYLSLKGKERVEKLRRAIGASKSFYRTLEKLRDAGFIEIKKVSHKERYVVLRKPSSLQARRLANLLVDLRLPAAISYDKRDIKRLLNLLEKQALLIWWNYIRSITAKRIEAIYVTAGHQPPKDMKPLKPEHLAEPLPFELRDLMSFMLDLHGSIPYELDKNKNAIIYRIAKERSRKLQRDVEEIKKRFQE